MQKLPKYPNLPALTTEQMVEVDRLMIEEWGITLIQMMENAGRNLAELSKRLLQDLRGKKIVVLCGTGNKPVPCRDLLKLETTQPNLLLSLVSFQII
jgi:hypothetical protein